MTAKNLRTGISKINVIGCVYKFSGYMPPEYAMHGHLSDKVDVYSFGVVALEIVSGRSNNKDHSIHLLDWVYIRRIHASYIFHEIMFQYSE